MEEKIGFKNSFTGLFLKGGSICLSNAMSAAFSWCKHYAWHDEKSMKRFFLFFFLSKNNVYIDLLTGIALQNAATEAVNLITNESSF